MHRNRVREIHLYGIRGSQMQRLASAMQGKFPALLHLSLTCSYFGRPSGLPDGFLDGSAPLLQSLKLKFFRFPALPNFLLSATHLVHLSFEEDRDSGYISHEEILNCLAVLSQLKYLSLGIQISSWESRHAPPPTSIVLPVLTHFGFVGYIGYLEVLVAKIDAPLLDSIWTNIKFNSTFDFPQLARFMRRSTCFQPPNEVHVDFHHPGMLTYFHHSGMLVDFHRSVMHVRSFPPRQGFGEEFRLKISCESYWDRSPLVKGFASLLPSIHMVDHLYIYPPKHSSPSYDGYMKLFHVLTGVKNLYISSGLAKSIASDLNDLVGESVADVLPALDSIHLEDFEPSGYDQQLFGQFTAARQLSGRPVTISTWDKTEDQFEF